MRKVNRRSGRSSVPSWLATATVLIYTVRGSGFLKHMVRNLVGTLIEVGRGNIGSEAFPARSGPTAPAQGLTLMSVEYCENK